MYMLPAFSKFIFTKSGFQKNRSLKILFFTRRKPTVRSTFFWNRSFLRLAVMRTKLIRGVRARVRVQVAWGHAKQLILYFRFLTVNDDDDDYGLWIDR